MCFVQDKLNEKQRLAVTSSEQLKELQVQLAQERVRASTSLAQVQVNRYITLAVSNL